MKILKIIIICTVSAISISLAYNYWENRNLIVKGELREFSLNIGEILILKLSENGSTEFFNCWVSEDKCNGIELIENYYKPSLQSKFGSIGSGGWRYYKFIAVAKGIDTIAIHNCSVKDIIGKESLGCDAFKNKIENPNYTVIIKINE